MTSTNKVQQWVVWLAATACGSELGVFIILLFLTVVQF